MSSADRVVGWYLAAAIGILAIVYASHLWVGRHLAGL